MGKDRPVFHATISTAGGISVYEIARKVERGTWPGMNVETLDDMSADPGGGIVLLPVYSGTNRDAGPLDGSNRDPFDRMIAAMTLRQGLTLVAKDAAFRSVAGLDILWD